MKTRLLRVLLSLLAVATFAGSVTAFELATAPAARADGGCYAAYDPPEVNQQINGQYVVLVRGYAYCGPHNMNNVTLTVTLFMSGVVIDRRTYSCGTTDVCVGHAVAPVVPSGNLKEWHGKAKVTWTHPGSTQTQTNQVGGVGVNCQYFYYKAV
jgi:hypothetical protein